ncbi:MAG: protein kinase [Vicinamibacteria bacterium]|nr:protein kinase [Vicinamibacteria bacterium]
MIAVPQVSARHAEIRYLGGEWFEVVDLGSSNGTWVNGQRVQSARVRATDQVRIGPVPFNLAALGHLVGGPAAAAVILPPPSAPPGPVLGRIGPYDAIRQIGEGGMGAVFLGRDGRSGRQVAIKVLHPQFRRDSHIVERFEAEARIQAALDHRNIVKVVDYVCEGDTAAMVLEYVTGESLEDIALRSPRLPLARVGRLMDQVLAAMSYAHARGLVHRDLKPSNILVEPAPDGEQARVLDFGVAKILGSQKARTATGARMGTIAYMSPEHLRSPKDADARSDIYSIGVILYELLSGRVPFDSGSEYELMRRIIEEPADLAALPDGVPPGLRALVARALEKLPDRRFQSCDEMRAALRACLPASAFSMAAASLSNADAIPLPSGHTELLARPELTETHFAAEPAPRPASGVSGILIAAAIWLLLILFMVASGAR